MFPFMVTAITKFGIYNHDVRYAYVSLPMLKQIYEQEVPRTLYKLALDGKVSLDAQSELIKKALDGECDLRKWSDINQNLFRAVEHQKWMLFAILEIIIGLAGMNVVNLLMVSAHHRRRDIAILRAMGMRFKNVFWFFLAQGTLVGTTGIALGIVFGYGVCRLVERFQPTLLREEVYNVSRLPVVVDWHDVLYISAGAFAVCVVFSVVPAIRAARARPVAALREL